MDAEPSEHKEFPEKIYKETLEKARQNISSLVDFATKNGVDKNRFAHISRLFTEDSHILLPPIEVMRSTLAEIVGDSDRTRRTRALTSRKTGQVFIPEEGAGSVHDALHESIHRAVWLHDKDLGFDENKTLLASKLAEIHGVKLSEEGKVDPESEYIRQYAKTERERQQLIEFFTDVLKEEVVMLNEGLTEYATRKSLAISGQVPDDELVYNDEVKMIDKIREKLIAEGNSSEEADAIFITAALTGDIGSIVKHL